MCDLRQQIIAGALWRVLFLEGDQLIAVDDIVYPKWIFTYDISESKHPKPVGIASLKQHTSYESIYGGADNDDYIALLSGGINHGECFKFISLLDKKTLKELWCWSTKKPKQYDSLLPLLTSDIVDPEQIEDIIGMINELGILFKDFLDDFFVKIISRQR